MKIREEDCFYPHVTFLVSLLKKHPQVSGPWMGSMRGTHCPPQEGSFHFASRFTEERTKIAKSDNDVDL